MDDKMSEQPETPDKPDDKTPEQPTKATAKEPVDPKADAEQYLQDLQKAASQEPEVDPLERIAALETENKLLSARLERVSQAYTQMISQPQAADTADTHQQIADIIKASRKASGTYYHKEQ